MQGVIDHHGDQVPALARVGKIKVLENDYVIHKLAHALAGCVAGAAAGGACQDGAIGAAVGEMVAGLFADTKPNAYATQAEWDTYNNKVLSVSKLAAGAVSAYAGGNAQTAITTAEVAVRNNFLTFDENQLRKQAKDACQKGNDQACADEKRWNQLDLNQDEKVRQVCTAAPSSQNCADWRMLALLARNSYSGKATVAGSIVFGAVADTQELQSIQKLLASTPHIPIIGKPDPKLLALYGIIADLTPVVGDVKAFYNAETPFDYALAMLGVLGPVGDGAAAAIRAAKAAHNAGNAVEAAAQLKKAEQFAINIANGRAFEGSGLQALGVDKNKYRVTAISKNGESITVIPDATIGGINGTLVEFKNVINITDTKQFRGYAATGQPIRLIVSPRTETISSTVVNAIKASGGQIQIFDPVTKTFKDWV